MTRHLTDDECLRLATDEGSDPFVSKHIECCSSCARNVKDWKTLVEFLKLPSTWHPDARAHDDGVAGILRLSSAELERLASTPFSGEFLRAGLDAVRILLHRAPRRALTLTEALTIVLERAEMDLPETAGTLAKERANALRRLGRYSEALQMLDNAEHQYRQLPAPCYELAFVDWGRATVFHALRRFGESREYTARSRQVFSEFGDEVSDAEVQLLEGAMLFDEGDVIGARALFAVAASILEQYGERPSLALAYQNLCTCDVRLNALSAAREYEKRAKRLMRCFEMDAEVVRLSWSMWEAVAGSGDRETALPYLQEAATGFRALGMNTQAAEVGLDILEQLIALERYDEAISLAQEVAAIYSAQAMPVDVAQAMAYLEQAVRASIATPESVRVTRAFIAARTHGLQTNQAPTDPPRP